MKKVNMTSSPPLLKEKAYIEIKNGILHEVFTPGQFLSERQLIDYLGMSKTPIKAALERLETEGFITVSPKQGIIVRELSLEKISHIYDLRMALEVFIVEQLAGKLRKEQIEALEQNLQQTTALAEAHDEKGFAQADADFHLLLCRFSGNTEIFRIMENYHDHLYRVVLRVLQRDPGRMQSSYEDHVGIYQSLLDPEPEESKRLMKEHILYGKRIFL
ncbi:GntR family transcriptional regulator [Ammoniphilus resinae]|uniref:DNA-binding GntR family transcriptional regulator n=1 Tax=Ammoniphilus resinae TaxID=861532 RepID=A0ABS4GPN1_9BACL|nr:GntR family transcriptional regulator [Ammoniphilus resinae]MBP1932228.1 DNA-binding GntR family transcriptional regulator [Ammoniphilus resinae]